jgi:flagellar FliJ protein
MPTFKFRLTTMLRLREATRDERRGLLAQAYAAQQKLADQRQELERQIGEHRSGKLQGAKGRLDVDRLLDANRYQLVLQAEMNVLTRQEAALEAETEKRRQALVIADRDVRVLEKLREKQYQRFLEQEAVLQGKQLDEIAGRRRELEEVD